MPRIKDLPPKTVFRWLEGGRYEGCVGVTVEAAFKRAGVLGVFIYVPLHEFSFVSTGSVVTLLSERDEVEIIPGGIKFEGYD